MDHKLVHLAQQINWVEVENEFNGYFSDNGHPSVPIRKMVGLMLLKSLYNLSDESTVARWVESIYLQYFTGEYVFQIKPPIDSADFSRFRRLPEQVEQIKRLSEMTIENVLVDRGYRGRKWIGDTKVEISGSGKAIESYYKKQKAKKKFRRRAGIEPVIGHLKHDHKMQRSYLKGNVGDSINTMMAAAGFNLKHWLNKVILVFNLIDRILIAELLNLLTENRNRMTLQPVGNNCEKKGVWQN